MAVVISNNMVLTTPIQSGNAGVIGYQNILNVNNVTATSSLATNPITNVANPATAYTWESAVADASDVVSYPNATNLMPSPFDPEGWYGATTDTDGTITNVSLANPSGESFVGLAEQTGAGVFIFATATGSKIPSVLSGEKVYAAFIYKISNFPAYVQTYIGGVGGSGNFNLDLTNKTAISSAGWESKFTELSSGYCLLETSYTVSSDSVNVSQDFILRGAGVSIPPIGSQLYVQAAFFGKNPLEYPYAQYNDFEDAAELGEWAASHCDIAITGGELLNSNNTSSSAQFSKTDNIEALKHNKMVVRWRRIAGIRPLEFRWNSSLSGGSVIHSYDESTQTPFISSIADGSYTITTFDFTQISGWDGNINYLRYDVGDTGEEFAFDYIKIYSPSLLQAYEDWWPAVVDEGGVKININTAGQEVDYIGIARHNLNQVGLTVAVKYNGITVVPATSISDAQALLFLQNIAIPDNVELIIKGATVAPQIGVIYVGKSLRLERNIYVGHTPITYGRNRTSINGVSENGQYLGEIVVREMSMTQVSLQNLTPIWYRTMLDPFFKLSPRPPCFWAWRPETYPDEVGFAWIEGNPAMSNQRSNGMVSANWNFKGTA